MVALSVRSRYRESLRRSESQLPVAHALRQGTLTRDQPLPGSNRCIRLARSRVFWPRSDFGSSSADHAARSLNTAVLLGVGFVTGKL
jgi:hypothetical protein